MRTPILVAAIAALVLMSAGAAAAGPSDRDAADGFAAAKAAVGAPDAVRLVIAPADAAADVALSGDTLTLPARALQLAHSRQELAGLYVLALGLAHAPPPEKGRRYSLEEWLAAGAAAVAGDEVDQLRRRNPDRYNLRRYDVRQDAQRATEAAAVSPRGRRLLAAMRRAGTCSGPALAYLDRLGRELPSRAATMLARAARDDFGPLAYPPEDDCVRD